MKAISKLRIAVGALGERECFGWWDSAFLNPTGLRFLGLVYPRTVASASSVLAAEAACRVHDERIGKGQVAHLFRLPHGTEMKVRAELFTLMIEELQGLCSKNAALELLDSVAAGSKPLTAMGPIQAGTLKEMNTQAGLRCLAATYSAGFRSGTRVFPYFA